MHWNEYFANVTNCENFDKYQPAKQARNLADRSPNATPGDAAHLAP